MIDQLNNGDVTLSFSSLKAFAESPAHFIAYKMGEKKTTEAMKKGSLIHCAILEPEQIERKYAVLRKEDLPNPDKDFRDVANRTYKASFDVKCQEQGLEVITQDQLDEAFRYRDMARSNEVVGSYLAKLVETEKRIKFHYEGFDFTGYIDGVAKNFILDLKTVSGIRPSKLKWQVLDNKYHWQQFLYKQAMPPYFDCFNLLADDSGLLLVKIDDSLLWQAEAEINDLLEKFRLCQLHNLWHQSYEFWAGEKGYFIIN